MSNQKLVAILILNWNGFEDSVKCITSIQKIQYHNYTIIVLDNGSKVNEKLLLDKKFGKRIITIRSKENVGYTGGCNHLLKYATRYKPDYFLLLNNDTEVEPNFLDLLVNSIESNKTIGIISPQIYDLENRSRLIFSGGKFDWIFGRTLHKTSVHNETTYEDFITGCCMLISKQVIDKIGYLDNRFFAYFEDAAYSIKAVKAGYKLACDGKSTIFHKEAGSTGKKSAIYTYLFSRNRILFINHYTNTLYKLYFFFFNLIKLVFVSTWFALHGQIERLGPFTKGFIDGNMGKSGKPNL